MACETRKTLDVIHKLKRFEDCITRCTKNTFRLAFMLNSFSPLSTFK